MGDLQTHVSLQTGDPDSPGSWHRRGGPMTSDWGTPAGHSGLSLGEGDLEVDRERDSSVPGQLRPQSRQGQRLGSQSRGGEPGTKDRRPGARGLSSGPPTPGPAD